MDRTHRAAMARDRPSGSSLTARPDHQLPALQAPNHPRATCSLAWAAAATAAVLGLITPALLQPPAAVAQSNLLDSVKRNPGQARKLCNQLREFNQQGLSYTSKKALQQIASQENLSLVDAEVLTTYVVGLHCPDVR